MINLTGIDLTTLLAWQSQAMASYAALLSGGKIVSASYSQGAGSKSVTYSAGTIDLLRPWLASLSAEIARRTGVCAPRRRAIGVKF